MATPATIGATPPPPRIRRRTLDRSRLLDAIAARQVRLAQIEDDLIAACEAAALRAGDRAISGDDPNTWDRAAWDRYLAEAAALEPDVGPALRRLHDDIARLDRLASMPFAT